jgi:hypothetical protein
MSVLRISTVYRSQGIWLHGGSETFALTTKTINSLSLSMMRVEVMCTIGGTGATASQTKVG